jgi:protocatechuate 3,4-dioxygenase beta subunit
MRKLLAYAFVAAMAALLAAPLAIAADVTVSGTVKDMENGAPIAGAKVTLSYWGDLALPEPDGSVGAPDEMFMEYVATTGADGSFTLSVAPGGYGVYAEAAGYEPYYGSIDTAYESTISVEMNKLPPYDAQLTVLVEDSATGAGVAGAKVYGWPDFTFGGEVGILGFPSYQEISGVTDAAGKLQTGIWNGAYTLSVSADGYFYASESVLVDGNDLTSTIEVTPVPSPNATLSGVVVDQSSGAPIAGAEISVYPDYSYMGANCWGGFPEPEPALTNAAGEYSVAVYGGASYISVYADDYYGYYASVNVPDNFAMDFDVALFPIIEPETVSILKGIVKDGDGAPVNGATVQATFWPNSYGYDYRMAEGRVDSFGGMTDPGFIAGNDMGFAPQEPAFGLGGGYYGSQPWYYETTTGANGAYSLAVPVGELSVSIWSEGYYPYYGWTSISYDGEFWLNATLSPVPEPDATIDGAVTDATTGEPVEGAYVSAYLVREPMEMFDEAVGQGILEGAGGASGVGTDSAVAPSPNFAPDKLDYMDPYGYYYADAVTDADGKFSLEVPHGEQAIAVWAEGYTYYSTTLSLEEGQTLVVELALTRSSDEGAMAGGMNGDGKRFVMPMGDDMNSMPGTGGSKKLSISPGESREIEMAELFQGGDGLTYSFESPDNLRVSYDEASGVLKVTAPDDWTGEEDITIKATDGTATVYKSMSVSVAPQSSFAVIAGFTAAIVIAAIVIAAIWKTQKE